MFLRPPDLSSFSGGWPFVRFVVPRSRLWYNLFMKETIKKRLHVATFSEDAVAVACEFGLGLELNHPCISTNLDEEKIEDTVRQARQDIHLAQAKSIIVHGPFTEIVPASIDWRFVDLALMRLNQAYDFAKAVGCLRMVVHSGYYPSLYFPSWHLEKSLEFWDRFLADKDDLTIMVENVFEEDPLLLKKLASEFNRRDQLQVCLDVGHANVMVHTSLRERQAKTWPVEEWIRELGDLVSHYHIHNNFGDKDTHRSLGDGTVDMASILETIEAYNPSPYTITLESKDCRRCVEWLNENV